MISQRILDVIPFLTTTDATLPEGRRMNWQKILETLFVAAATAIAVNYNTTLVLRAQYQDLSAQVQHVEQRLDSMQQEMYYGNPRGAR